MGNSSSVSEVLGKDVLEDYVQLTYLHRSEICYIFKLLDDVEPGKLRANPGHRFSTEQIDKILPQIEHNPFRDSIYRVFSSKEDGRLSFEDLLDLCSNFSENCPVDVRAAWAYRIFDLDGDNQVSLDDLIEAIQRLTRLRGNGEAGIDHQDAEHVARMILQEMDLSNMGSISAQEFVHLIARMPDFSHTFCFRI